MDIDKSASKKVDIMVLKTLDTFVYCQAYSALSGLSPNSRPKASYKFPKILSPSPKVKTERTWADTKITWATPTPHHYCLLNLNFLSTWHSNNILTLLFHFVKQLVDKTWVPLQKIYHFTDYFYLHFTIHSMQILTFTRNLK